MRRIGETGAPGDLITLKCDFALLKLPKLLHTCHHFTENIAFSHVLTLFDHVQCGRQGITLLLRQIVALIFITDSKENLRANGTKTYVSKVTG